MNKLFGSVVMLLVAFETSAAANQTPTFHGIKLGDSLGSQFRECPWNPPKQGDIPEYVSPPDKDDKGNTIPCFHELGIFKAAAYPQEVWSVQLFDGFRLLKDSQGNYLQPEPLPGLPVLQIVLLVPPSALLRDGTTEEVTLTYLPIESDRVREALIEKFGASHPSEKKISPKMMEWWGTKIISSEVWETSWGELTLTIINKFVNVLAKTSKLMRFELERKKDEF